MIRMIGPRFLSSEILNSALPSWNFFHRHALGINPVERRLKFLDFIGRKDALDNGETLVPVLFKIALVHGTTHALLFFAA